MRPDLTPIESQRTRPTTPPDDGRWGILLFAGAVALTAVTCVAALLVDSTGWRLGLLVAAVAVIAERSVDARTALGCAVTAFGLGDGFLQHHRAGTLGWDALDLFFALGLLGAVAIGMAFGQVRLAPRTRSGRWLPPTRKRSAAAPQSQPSAGRVVTVTH